MFDQQRATIFGEHPEHYDRYRPAYPSEVIDFVVEGAPKTAVEAGCGTGKATTLVAARGVEVLGVEPDAPGRIASAATAAPATGSTQCQTWAEYITSHGVG